MPEPIQPKHGNVIGDALRVRLCGGPFIDRHSMETLKDWQIRGTSYGLTIDRLITHAKTTGFDPVLNKILKTKNRTAPKS